MRSAVLLGLLLIFADAASADGLAACRTSPRLAGPCFVVHGRLSIANGYWNHRIWPVGTRRMLAVVDSQDKYDENTVPLPESIRKMLEEPGSEVFADYQVCPLTRSRPGHMQHVCMVSASHVFVRKTR
ncbi:MAG: hypothetical protein KGJ78_07135 [Alphaproteobacteria bacterium]|nr:hypothetical protein [Alphaproteobacteria bacterium]